MAHFGIRMWRRQPRRLDRKPSKKVQQSGRKPLGPPIGDTRSRRRDGIIIPCNQLPVHVQAAQVAERRRYDPDDD